MRRLFLAGAGALVLGSSLPASAAVVMSDGKGRVEVVPEGGGRGRGILPGEPLGSGTLSVGDGSMAAFSTEDGAKLRLDGSARARLTDTSVALEAGKVEAQTAGKSVTVKAGALEASGLGAQFVVALADDGAVDVSSEKGTVSLSMDGAKSQLAAGQKLHLAKGDALGGAKPAAAKVVDNPFEKPAKAEEKPAEAEKKPEPKEQKVAVAETPKPEPKPEPKADPKPEAKADPKPAEPPAPAGPPALKVKWPSGSVATVFTLRGTTAPGAKVMVNDVAATVKKNGSFSAKLTLDEGENQISVKATGADGQESSDAHALTAVVPAAKPDDAAAPSDSSKPAVKQEAAGWE